MQCDYRVDLEGKMKTTLDDFFKIKREVLDCYLIILKNLPISFYKAFEEGENNYLITIESCLDIFSQKFSYYYLLEEALDKVIRNSIFYRNDNEIEDVSTEAKKDYFFLSRYNQRSSSSFQMLLNNFKNNKQNEEKDISIADQIIISNRDFDLNLVFVVDILKRNFRLNGDLIQLENFFNFFVDKFSFKIKISNFLQSCFEIFEKLYCDLDKSLLKIWENADYKRNGIIFFREFENVMNVLMGNSENKWKISEYFK